MWEIGSVPSWEKAYVHSSVPFLSFFHSFILVSIENLCNHTDITTTISRMMEVRNVRIVSCGKRQIPWHLIVVSLYQRSKLIQSFFLSFSLFVLFVSFSLSLFFLLFIFCFSRYFSFFHQSIFDNNTDTIILLWRKQEGRGWIQLRRLWPMRFGLEDRYNNGPMEATITVHSTTLLVIRKTYTIKWLFFTLKISTNTTWSLGYVKNELYNI